MLFIYIVIAVLVLGGGIAALYQYRNHQQELLGQAVISKGLATDMRRLAIESGADELALESFHDGDQRHITGGEMFNLGEYKAAAELFDIAADYFRESRLIASGVQAGLEAVNRLKEEANRLGVPSDNPGWIASGKALRDARQAILADDISRALVQIKVSSDGFNAAIRQSPRQFTKGSNAGEIKSALALCIRYMDDCEERWYRTELIRKVLLKPYRIDPYEVTQSDFSEFADQTGFITEAEQRGYSYHWDGSRSRKVKGASWRSPGNGEDVSGGNGDFPARHIAFNDARAYCKWKGGRIPTESEWEYAARGPERNMFPWGNKWDGAQVQIGNVSQPTAIRPVGSYPPAVSGFMGYDFSGSVWEWVWQDTGKKPVLKGGSYLETNPANFRSAAAKVNPAGVSQSDDGFRCVMDAVEWPVEISAQH